MPLTLRSRSTARPPMARPSASIGWPVRGQRHGEADAARPQGLDRMLHRGRLAGIEPAAERQHAMRLGHAEDLWIAVDGGLVRAAGQSTTTCGSESSSALWDLEAAFLDQGPTDSAVMESLRAARKLPEEQDFRQWKTRAA